MTDVMVDVMLVFLGAFTIMVGYFIGWVHGMMFRKSGDHKDGDAK